MADYASGLERARALIREGRLNDPGEHFPYKHGEVTALLEENPPAGPNGPDDDSMRASDHMSQQIADATRLYVEAQEAFLRNPGDATQAEYQAAAENLAAARAYHRRGRKHPVINGGS